MDGVGEAGTSLAPFRLHTPAPSVHLIPDFVSEAEEAFLLKKTDEVGSSNVVVKEDGSMAVRSGGWTTLNNRRSMYWGGLLSPKGALIPQPPPPFMTAEWPRIFDRIAALHIFDDPTTGERRGPNHCLVNEYLPGDGIMPHTDGPAYNPAVATLSLGSSTVYELHPRRTDDLTVEPFSIFVPARSLIVLSSDCYTSFLHGIPARASDSAEDLRRCVNWPGEVEQGLERERRVSLTCRRVEKVAKGLARFGQR